MFNKIAVEQIPPFLLAGIRFTVASILIFNLMLINKQSLQISRLQLKNTLIAGFLFLSFGNGMAVWALQFLDSGFVALEIAAQPLVILLMMWILEGKKIPRKSMIGIGLGIIGMYFLVGNKELITNPQLLYGILVVFLCMLGWSYGSLFVAKNDMPKNFFLNTAYQMLFGGLLLLGISLSLGEQWLTPKAWYIQTWISLFALIVFGAIAAFTAFNYLLKVVSPEKVATSAYINPIVALFAGWLFLGEIISLNAIVAAVILLTGVYFINSSKT